MEKVFVYGTLKPGEINYQLYCAPYIVKATPAYTQGHLFDLPLGYPAMSPGRSRVEGYLLSFDDNRILKSLDDLEGFDPQVPPQKNEYCRRKTLVYTLAGALLGEAWTYLMSPQKIQQLGGVELPSGVWRGLKSSF